MSKRKMEHARRLIKSKRYVEASRMLEGVDHPQAVEWRQRIDGILVVDPFAEGDRLAKKKKRDRVAGCIMVVIGGILLLAIAAYLAYTFIVIPTVDSTTTDIVVSRYCQDESSLTEAQCDEWTERIKDDPVAAPIIAECERRAGDMVLIDGIGFCLESNGVFPPQ